jgi:hypothetical protein
VSHEAFHAAIAERDRRATAAEGGFPYPAAYRIVKPLIDEGAVPTDAARHHFVTYLEQYHGLLIGSATA